jgi:hypothetical protein
VQVLFAIAEVPIFWACSGYRVGDIVAVDAWAGVEELSIDETLELRRPRSAASEKFPSDGSDLGA